MQEGEDITREEDDEDEEEEDENEYEDEDFEDERQRKKRRRHTGFILEEAGLCSLSLKLNLSSCDYMSTFVLIQSKLSQRTLS